MNRYQTYLGLIGYLFIGTAVILVPSVMPSITEEFAATGMTLAAIGLIFPAREIGGLLGNLLSGIGSDVIGRRRFVWLAALLLATALGLAAIMRIWAIFVVAFMLVSAAQASLSTGINAMIADANRAARGRALNTLHAVYGIGAAISPLAIGYLLEQGLPWRWALAGAGLIWLLYGAVAWLSYHAEATAEQAGPTRKLDLTMLRRGPFFALFVIAFVYNGVAWSLLGWVALFMQQTAGFSTFFSVSMISIF
ncbi:MAG: MFS transporter, partial [Caldilineaceae bacterium]